MDEREPMEIYADIQPLVVKEIKTALEKSNRERQFGVVKIPVHQHNGTDSSQVDFADLTGRVMTFSYTIFGASAAIAGNYGVFFTAPFSCVVISFSEVHQTKGTVDGTLQLEKLTSGVAPDSGVVLLSSALSLTTTNNTPQYGTVLQTYTGSVRNASLVKGDRLCLKDANTLTTIDTVTVTTQLLF